MAARAARQQREQYPEHEYADEHTLFIAAQSIPPRRRLRDASELKPSGEVACERIREFGWDMGAEVRDTGAGWMAGVSRDVLGISESCGWWILSGNATSVHSSTVDKVAAKTGLDPAVFYAR